MAGYKIDHDPVHNSYTIQHRGKVVATVDSELTRKGGIFHKPRYSYYVANIPGAPRAPFINSRLAIDHAIKLHKDIKSGRFKDHNNPVRKAGEIINQLGQVIWDSSRDPRFNDLESQERIQDLSIHHANLVRIYNKHFGGK